ncbi:MAG: NPCBM/NEW2 domain-containing protein, partial [Planctomycetes bacterium]|nr:NPCBM/NEW2 domain-containing protein [Planctomycetota bacterium]
MRSRWVFVGVASVWILACAAASGRARAADDAAILRAADPPENGIWLETLDLGKIEQDWGSPRARRSVDGNPIRLKGVEYRHGIGTHARSEFGIDLKGAAVRFLAMAGVDDERTRMGSITFEVLVDGKRVFESGVLRGGDEPKLVSVDLKGAKRLVLIVGDGDDGIDHDHADWAGALLILEPAATAKPEAWSLPPEPPPTIASGTKPEPAIHGPRIVGATPGRPFLFLVPATGVGPLRFSARGLPDGLAIDETTGIISGALRGDGEKIVELSVAGPRGRAMRKLKIVGGTHRLALTPPLGWNSWNVWAGAVSDDKVRDAADGMVASGLAAHGFQYINIDDTWEGKRDADGELGTNEKFPDMKALADYVHSKGLKLGIYSSPGPKTCAGFEGSFGHEVQDARAYARWG